MAAVRRPEVRPRVDAVAHQEPVIALKLFCDLIFGQYDQFRMRPRVVAELDLPRFH